MTFNGGQLSASETLHFDGSLETNGNFRLFGGSANDVIKGGAGNDLIYGGLGQDDLTGGAGADTFRYQGTGESTATATDRILDFASGDIIDLGRIDAVTGGNDDAFHIVGAFDGQAGELVLTQGANNVWTVSGDVDGNGQADFQILVTVSDSHTLTASDFVL
jgi:Ca2+-binding RTX toxin-like protein